MAKRAPAPAPGILTTFQMRPEVHAACVALKHATGISLKEFVSRAVENELARIGAQVNG